MCVHHHCHCCCILLQYFHLDAVLDYHFFPPVPNDTSRSQSPSYKWWAFSCPCRLFFSFIGPFAMKSGRKGGWRSQSSPLLEFEEYLARQGLLFLVSLSTNTLLFKNISPIYIIIIHCYNLHFAVHAGYLFYRTYHQHKRNQFSMSQVMILFTRSVTLSKLHSLFETEDKDLHLIAKSNRASSSWNLYHCCKSMPPNFRENPFESSYFTHVFLHHMVTHISIWLKTTSNCLCDAG